MSTTRVQPAPLDATPFLLNDGLFLPPVGLGTYGLSGQAGVDAIVTALRAGYRLLDTAVGYRNEAEVGEALRISGIPRGQVIVTTKITGRGHGYDAARRSIDESRRILGIEQVGLHLIHWPTPSVNKYVDTWRALIRAQSDGDVRSIGVSNFTQQYLQEIIDATGVVPAVNQIELHPHLPQHDLRRIHRDLGICTQSWSPLGRGSELFDTSEVRQPAARLGITPSQVVLRWHRQLAALPIPRSRDAERQRTNLEITSDVLTTEEISAISALGHDGSRLWGGDPETTEFW